jgi:hypothetical protein
MAMTWLLWLVLVLCLVIMVAVGATAYGAAHWRAIVGDLAGRLEAARVDERSRSASTARFDSRELDGLPAPVQRYFRAVLKEGQPIVAAVTIEMLGTMNMSSTGGEQWRPFTARQRVITRRPGFMWDARMPMAPGIPVWVLDSYVAGSGLLHAAVLGLFTVANVRGAGEIARGELMRFFAEAAWYPTALLPSQGVTWQALDAHSAHATIVDGPLTLALLFRFNDAGLIDSVRAEARGGMVDGKVVMMPWECSLSGYELREGMRVPITGEAAWVWPDGRKPYFHGTISSLHYEFAPQ